VCVPLERADRSDDQQPAAPAKIDPLKVTEFLDTGLEQQSIRRFFDPQEQAATAQEPWCGSAFESIGLGEQLPPGGLKDLLSRLSLECRQVFKNPQDIISGSFEFATLTRVSTPPAQSKRLIVSCHLNHQESSFHLLVADGSTIPHQGANVPCCMIRPLFVLRFPYLSLAFPVKIFSHDGDEKQPRAAVLPISLGTKGGSVGRIVDAKFYNDNYFLVCLSKAAKADETVPHILARVDYGSLDYGGPMQTMAFEKSRPITEVNPLSLFVSGSRGIASLLDVDRRRVCLIDVEEDEEEEEGEEENEDEKGEGEGEASQEEDHEDQAARATPGASKEADDGEEVDMEMD